VRKEVFATIIGRDEAKALRVVEPFNRTGCHFVSKFEIDHVIRRHVRFRNSARPPLDGGHGVT
jgi:hypothetical protein